MSKELLSRIKPELLLAYASRAASGTAYAGITIDTMKLIDSSLSEMYDNPQNALLLIYVPTFGASGTITLTVKHKNDNEDFATHSTISAMTQASGATLYVAEIKNFRRFVRVDSVVGTQTSAFSIIGLFGQSRSNPVKQSFTELTVTEA